MQDDSIFVHEAIKEAIAETGLTAADLYPKTDRLRASILFRAQELKSEYHEVTK